MAVNWNAGLMRWAPHGVQHSDFDGPHFSLNHLHPFRFLFDMPATRISPARSVMVYVGFALHTFTREKRSGDHAHLSYWDDRENSRVFDADRYTHSFALPRLIRSWPSGSPPCSKAKEENFVSVDLGGGARYAVFFNVKRWPKMGNNAVLLVVQSAYALDPEKEDPGKGKYSFSSIIGNTLKQPKIDSGPDVTRDFRMFLEEQEAAALALLASESENPTEASLGGVP